MSIPCPARRFPSTLRSRPGFTLIELLIVIGVIGVLVGVVAVLGSKVIGGGKDRAAEGTIRVLDASLTEYETSTNQPAPAFFEYRDAGKPYQYAILDARPVGKGNFDRVNDLPVDSIARYTALLSQTTSAQDVLKQINPKFVRQVAIDTINGNPVTGLEIVDPWDNPIRAVHPSFDGGYGAYYAPGQSQQLIIPGRDMVRTVSERRGNGNFSPDKYRRSFKPFTDLEKEQNPTWVGDADEGMCPNKRIYFYSSGGDGDPGTRANNVYTTRPTFPAETAKY